MMNRVVQGSVALVRNGLVNPLFCANVRNSIPSAWTVSAWVKARSSPTYGAFFKLGNQAPGSGVALGFGNSEFTIDTPGTKLIGIAERFAWIDFGSFGTIDEWHHCALSVNGSNMKLYRDGVIASSKTTTLYRDGSCNLSIGTGYAQSPMHGAKRSFEGNIVRFAFWSRNLSDSEVAADFADGGSMPTTTNGLEHFWPLSSASNYLSDLVGNATLTEGAGCVSISTDAPSYQQGGGKCVGFFASLSRRFSRCTRTAWKEAA